MKIVRSLSASKKFNYEKIKSFLYFMDQLIPLTDNKLKIIFDQEITKLFGGNITMGIMEAVREQILDEGIEQGIEQGKIEGIEQERAHKNFEFVERLLEKAGWSDEQTADVANVSVAYVNEVRNELASRK